LLGENAIALILPFFSVFESVQAVYKEII